MQQSIAKDPRLRAVTETRTWKRAWSLLSVTERRNAFLVLTVGLFSAAFSAVGVGSILPFLSVLADPDKIAETRALSWAYDKFGFESAYSFLVYLAIISGIFIVLSNAVQMLNAYIAARYTTKLMHSISQNLFALYLRQPLEFFLNRHSGDMASNILSEAQYVVSSFFKPATDFFISVFTMLTMLTLLSWVNPFVTLAAIAVIGGAYMASYLASQQAVRRLGQDRATANRERHRITNEALGGIKDLKILGAEKHFFLAFQKPSKIIARSQVWLTLVSQMPRYFIYTVAFCGILVLCLSLIDPNSFESGNSLGGLLPVLGVFAFAAQRTLPEVQMLYAALTSLRFGAASVDRLYEDLFDRNSSGASLSEKVQPLGLHQKFLLEGVSYRYPASTDKGLSDVSIEIEAGMNVGIVGSTGAGKTTLSDIILGLLKPSQGQVFVDGVPINDANQNAWLASVGYVPQEIFLLDASVTENIAFGVPLIEIDMSRIRQVAEVAQIAHIIERELPDSYDTKIGERGVRLSGGQRQRIGIARALYHQADLIVFDEATSSLDNLTESELMEAIDGLSNDKTILMIAHRLSTVRKCDTIIYMEDGRVAAQGSWDTLLQTCKPFRQIAEIGRVA